jgi:hypothetical protein
MVEGIGDVIGRRLTYREVPPDAARRRYTEMGAPDGFAGALVAFLATCAEERATVTGEVERILRRPALTFARWVADNKEAFLP